MHAGRSQSNVRMRMRTFRTQMTRAVVTAQSANAALVPVAVWFVLGEW